jgi:hypothetical protein
MKTDLHYKLKKLILVFRAETRAGQGNPIFESKKINQKNKKFKN